MIKDCNGYDVSNFKVRFNTFETIKLPILFLCQPLLLNSIDHNSVLLSGFGFDRMLNSINQLDIENGGRNALVSGFGKALQ